jgi:hypothetical protein
MPLCESREGQFDLLNRATPSPTTSPNASLMMLKKRQMMI